MYIHSMHGCMHTISQQHNWYVYSLSHRSMRESHFSMSVYITFQYTEALNSEDPSLNGFSTVEIKCMHARSSETLRSVDSVPLRLSVCLYTCCICGHNELSEGEDYRHWLLWHETWNAVLLWLRLQVQQTVPGLTEMRQNFSNSISTEEWPLARKLADNADPMGIWHSKVRLVHPDPT